MDIQENRRRPDRQRRLVAGPADRRRCRTDWLRSVVLCLLLASSSLLAPVDANVCSGCYNGGKLLLPNNIFGLCRCKCPPKFKGLQCEFVGKRSSPDFGPSAGLNSVDADYGRKVSALEYVWSEMKDRPDLFSGSRTASRLLAVLGAMKRAAD